MQAKPLPLGVGLRARSMVARQLEGNWRGHSALFAGTGNLHPFPFLSTKPGLFCFASPFCPLAQTILNPLFLPHQNCPGAQACPLLSTAVTNPFLPLASLSSPSRSHSRCFLVLSFPSFRGIVIGCALIRISPRIPRLSSTPRNPQPPPRCARLIRFLNSLKCAVSKPNTLQ